MTTDMITALLPQQFRAALLARFEKEMPPEEVRLRAGQAPTVLAGGKEQILAGCGNVRPRDVEAVVELATGASVHTAKESIRRGFITAAGGIRIGLCGSTIIGSGGIEGLKQLSSVAIRLPREVKGCADAIMPEIMAGGFGSTLLISPPGVGKTTLLRELVRCLSSAGIRVSLVDERGEVAAVYGGIPQLDVGWRTDVMNGAGKAQAVMMLLRSMSPQVIALDEITAPEDISAISVAANCGIQLLATAHASSIADLKARPLYNRLLDQNIFHRAVIIKPADGRRKYVVEELI